MSSPDIAAITKKINALAHTHPIGELQEIRTRLKKFSRRPGKNIFSTQTTFQNWAFHHGGRKELQFNIGWEDKREIVELRHGVAFSLELSQALQSIDPLLPKIKLFNDFMELNASEYDDMRMWHYASSARSADSIPGPINQRNRQRHRKHSSARSADSMPGPIPHELAEEGIFIFLGNRQPASKINFQVMLDDFDRLLSLYEYVESDGTTQPVTLPTKMGFVFKAGCTIKASSAKATQAEKQLDLNLRHNDLQLALYHKLVSTHGKDNVGTELPSGVRTSVDIVVRQNGEYWFYEIKTTSSPRACLREALGQILEYAFWPGGQEATRLIVAGESVIDEDGVEYLRRLRTRFSLPIEYQQIVI
jgi:hypothetical protein